MKAHTIDFKNQLTELGRELRGVITYNNTELEEEIYSITPHYNADLLKSVMKQLDIELSVDIPLNTIINCQIGIKVNEQYEMLNYGNYVVYKSEKQEDTNTYKLTCYDKMLYSMKQNEDLGINYPIKIKDYLIALGNKIGLSVANTTFYNQDMKIPSELYLGQEYTYRDILDEIAQATGSIICLNENDEIVVKYPTQTNDTIDEDYLKDINVDFGQKYGVINSIVLSRSGESDNVYLRDEKSVAQNGLTEVKIVDNQIMNFNNRSDYLQGILNALNGLYYYLNDFNSTGILYYDVGDLYNVRIGENTYQCLMLNDEINVTTGIEEIIHTDMPEKSETDYSKADKTDRRINQTYLIVDKQNQTIDAVVKQTVDKTNPKSTVNKVSRLNIRVGELESSIKDIADITTYGESDRAEVELKDINKSEPIMIKVHPTSTNISYLYPRENLYPSDLQYLPNRIIRFTNTEKYRLTQDLYYNNFRKYYSYNSTDDEYILLIAGTDYTVGNSISGDVYENVYIDYPLPDDLLRYSDTVYDEFYLNYESQTCQVIKRCAYNADGTVRALGTEITTDYEYPTIILGEGNYTITLPGYDFGYLYVRLMAKNIYTTQFYTKVETDSIIDQKANEINLGVNQTLTNYSTTNQMNSAITLKANEITSSVNKKLVNYDTSSEVNSKIEQKADSITSSVSKTYETKTNASNTYATKTQLTNAKSEIKQTTDSITSTVNKKVGNNEIISKINQSAEAVGIKANKINLSANDILNLLAGNTINLSSKNIEIKANDILINNHGMSFTYNNSKVGEFVADEIAGDSSKRGVAMNISSNAYFLGLGKYDNNNVSRQILAFYNNPTSHHDNSIQIGNPNWNTFVTIHKDAYVFGYLSAANLINRSLETLKKDIEKSNFNATKEVMNTDIYSYRLKEEKENQKKHFGVIIGDNYKCSDKILNEDKDGVELYSMTSILWKAFQEQQEEIEELKKEIEKLKGGK